MKRYMVMLLTACMLWTLMIGCQSHSEEIENSNDALQVADPGQSSLPEGTLEENSVMDSQIAESSQEQSEMISSEESQPEESDPETAEESESQSSIPQTASNYDSLDTNQVTWGPGVHMDSLNRPEACVSLQEQYGQWNALFLGNESSCIYLTFDEGYENGYTAAILDTLKEKNVCAAFFVTLSYVESEPELVQRMIDEGHVVGNHTAHHPNMTTISAEEMEQEVSELHQYMLDEFGYEMTQFRAPEGAFSELSLAVLQDMGYQSVFWSFAYHDWDPNNQMDPSEALQKCTERLHPGAVYLLHAVSRTNSEILGNLIDTARAQGYQFISLEN